ncbi:hypothetical protein ACFQZS_15575 [Mucilaginibacter calamicampi]|uniref:Uncharacterized protein n=1 Tax=Mucilaginibacter calamicampi TaxID=1302352 RepID=A0ABW2Z1G6_9SPHI
MPPKLTILFFSAIFCLNTSKAQTFFELQSNFTQIDLPKYPSKVAVSLNHSNNEFEVAINKGKLTIIKKGNENTNCNLKLSNGTLVGIDNGEWGGQLLFKPNDGKKKNIEVHKGNIKFIFRYRDKIYFIESLAHLSISEGALFQLIPAKNGFSTTKLIDFGDAPLAFTIFNNKFLIATYDNFYTVSNFKKQLVVEKAFWDGLYPNSLAVLNDKDVFIGMRGGVAMLDLTTGSLKFYKYNYE